MPRKSATEFMEENKTRGVVQQTKRKSGELFLKFRDRYDCDNEPFLLSKKEQQVLSDHNYTIRVENPDPTGEISYEEALTKPVNWIVYGKNFRYKGLEKVFGPEDDDQIFYTLPRDVSLIDLLNNGRRVAEHLLESANRWQDTNYIITPYSMTLGAKDATFDLPESRVIPNHGDIQQLVFLQHEGMGITDEQIQSMVDMYIYQEKLTTILTKLTRDKNFFDRVYDLLETDA